MGSLVAIVAELAAVARRVQPVLKHVVRIGARIAAHARLVLIRHQRNARFSPVPPFVLQGQVLP